MTQLVEIQTIGTGHPLSPLFCPLTLVHNDTCTAREGGPPRKVLTKKTDFCFPTLYIYDLTKNLISYFLSRDFVDVFYG